MYVLLPIMVAFCGRRNASSSSGHLLDASPTKESDKRKQDAGAMTNTAIGEVEPASPCKNGLPDGDNDSLRSSSMALGSFRSTVSERKESGGSRRSISVDDDDAEENRSLVSRNSASSSVSSIASFLTGAILDGRIGPILDTPARKEKFRKRTRNAMERLDAELEATEGKLVSKGNNGNDDDDDKEEEEDSLSSECHVVVVRRQANGGDDGCGSSSGSAGTDPPAVSNGVVDPDEVSFQDAVDGKPRDVENRSSDSSEEVTGTYHDGSCCAGLSRRRRRMRRAAGKSYGKLLSIAEWDYETRRIYKLGFPFFLQALLEGVTEIGRVAIIGRLMGTKELAAYVTVDLLISFTSQVLGGFHESLVSLLSHSIGCGNRKLTGQVSELLRIVLNVNETSWSHPLLYNDLMVSFWPTYSFD